MKYVVRTKEGELAFNSLEELRKAAQMGFVEPDDEVQQEGEPGWEKASAIIGPVSRRRRGSFLRDPFLRWVAGLAAASIFALFLVYRGREEDDLTFQVAGIAIIVVAAVTLTRVTTRVQKR